MSEIKFFRTCPSCGCSVPHKQKGHRDEAERKERVCNDCRGKLKKSPNQSLTRNCPSCSELLSYPNASAQRRAEKTGRKCYKCANKSEYDINERTRTTRNCPICLETVQHKKVHLRRRAEKKKTPCISCGKKSMGLKLQKKVDLDKDKIYQDYYIHELTAEQIAVKFSKKTHYIHRVLKKWGFTSDLHVKKLHQDGLRKCNKCKEVKPLSDFDQFSKGLCGLNSQCKNCYKTTKTNYYFNEHNRAKERAKEWRYNNSERARELSKIKMKKSREVNPYIHRMRGILSRFIKDTKQNKTTRTIEMLGYSFEDFKEHISNFDLPIQGNHVDHIIPLSWFKQDVPAHVCNSLENLQVITENENEVKSQWWAHPINKTFYEDNILWIKEEFQQRFVLVDKNYIDVKSPYYE